MVFIVFTSSRVKRVTWERVLHQVRANSKDRLQVYLDRHTRAKNAKIARVKILVRRPHELVKIRASLSTITNRTTQDSQA